MNKSTKNATRLPYVDVAKFIGLFCVIFVHAVIDHPKGNPPFVAYICAFHLPIFFILNGITLKIDKELPFGLYLEKKIKSYIVPMFCLCTLIVLSEFWILEMQNKPIDWFILGKRLIDMLGQKRMYSIWFVGALFFADVFFFFVVQWGKGKLSLCGIISLLFLGGGIFANKYYNYPWTWNIDVSLFGVFFIYIGYAWSHACFSKIKNFIIKTRIHSLLFGVVFFAIGFFLARINYVKYNLHLEMWARQYKKYYLVIPSAVFLSLGVILFSFTISNFILALLGQTTFVLLAFHKVFTFPLFAKILFKKWTASIALLSWPNFDMVIFWLCETMFSIVILVAVHFLIVYSPFSFILNKKPLPIYVKWATMLKLKVKTLAKKCLSVFYKNKAESMIPETINSPVEPKADSMTNDLEEQPKSTPDISN